MMECSYVYVMSNLMNTNVGQNMDFFMTVISNLCINQNVVGISFIIELMHIFVFWRIKTERQRKI